MLVHAFAWRRCSTRPCATRRSGPAARRRPAAGARPRPGAPRRPTGARAIADKIAPLRLPSGRRARRVNLLIPTIDLRHFFGGYIAKLNLAKRLADAVFACGSCRSIRSLPARAGAGDRDLQRARRRLRPRRGRVRARIAWARGEPGRRFIATTWWTAHIAHAALRELGRERFLYLIQEYEPFTFPMGSYAALAAESYTFPHVALFSTELLRDYFRRRGIGVYASGDRRRPRSRTRSPRSSLPPPPSSPAASRRLLFYARPEPHAARNMFELGVLALGRAPRTARSTAGHCTESAPSRAPAARPRRRSIAGAAPARPPGRLRARAARPRRRPRADVHAAPEPGADRDGLRRDAHRHQHVREQDGGRDEAISPNLITAAPDVESVAAALVAAVAGAGDVDARAGSRVDWSRDWDASFADALLDAWRAAVNDRDPGGPGSR